MRCVSPISLKTKEGRMSVPCGTCIHCLTKRQQDWSFRLQQELKISNTSHFITLTYEGDHLPIHEAANSDGELIYQFQLSKRDLQLFMKRLRKSHSTLVQNYLKINNKIASTKKLRYYAVGEYGTETKRPHYHLLLFNLNPATLLEIKSIWGKGHVDIGHVTPKSITYVTKYVITARNHFYGTRQKPFSTMSKQPGIGNNYLLDNKKWHKDNKYHHVVNSNGNKQALPDYYKNKIFDRREKEDHKLRNEQKLINKEIKEDKRQEKLGNNPYTIRMQQTENKLRKHNKQTKKDKL